MKSFSYDTITISQLKHQFHKELFEDKTLHTDFMMSFSEDVKHENMKKA